MATFQFSNHTIELDFCEQVHFSIDPTNEMQDRYQEACNSLVEKSKSGANDFDELCDCVMDAIDKIIGEDGAADRILELKGNYTFFDAIDVFKYISSEINEAISKIVNGYAPVNNVTNHLQRRAAARAGK